MSQQVRACLAARDSDGWGAGFLPPSARQRRQDFLDPGDLNHFFSSGLQYVQQFSLDIPTTRADRRHSVSAAVPGIKFTDARAGCRIRGHVGRRRSAGQRDHPVPASS